jgi:hypothetical protein
MLAEDDLVGIAADHVQVLAQAHRDAPFGWLLSLGVDAVRQGVGLSAGLADHP